MLRVIFSMNMIFERKLTIPKEVKQMYPLSDAMRETVSLRAEEIKRIFTGESEKLLLVIGPCSADRADSVLEYITRLCRVQENVGDKIFIVPRLYTNKPRTTGDGYMGMLHQPDPGEKPDMLGGIIAVREMYMRVLRETGFTCADEMLYPENHKYFDDILAYTAVGARSVENQQHRLTASGVEIPVGMKNPLSGNISVMLNSVCAAQREHTFIYRGWEVHSKGNPLAHAILRGYVENETNRQNCGYASLCSVAEKYEKAALENPAVIVDTNHSNSDKDPLRQAKIAFDVMKSRQRDKTIKKLVKGFMIESYLEDGRQDVGGGAYGKSITDACLGWSKTEKLIYELAQML